MSNFDTRFINFLTILLMLGLISGLTACHQNITHQFTPLKSQSIIGGTAVEKNSPFSSRVIYLAIGVEKKITPFGLTIRQKGICTASALTNRILITAAHCVQDMKSDQVYAVLSTNPLNRTLDPKEWIGVDQIKIHENFIGHLNEYGDDLAMIKLSEAIPSDRISKLVDAGQIDPDHVELIAVGYGQTTTLRNPDHSAPTQSKSAADEKAEPTLLNYVMRTVAKFQLTAKMFQVNQNDFMGVCQGDSGGPGYIYDEGLQEFYILGITSYVSIYPEEKARLDPTDIYNACIGSGNYTNVLAYQDWIAKSLSQLR